MAVVLIGWVPSRGAYEAMEDEVGRTAAPGCIVHTASEVDGKVRVVDVWESRQHIDQFFQARSAVRLRSSASRWIRRR